MSEPKKGNFIGQAWLVILLALLYGSGLAAVQMSLGPKIAENKKNETYNVIPELVPGAVKDDTIEHPAMTGTDGKPTKVYQAMQADEHLGWVIPTYGLGFADKIELLIGVDADVETITGLYVLSQKETPGLGDYITGKDFRDRFLDKPTDTPLVIVKADPSETHEILSLTGATISSESVSNTINKALSNLKAALKAETSKAGGETDAAPQTQTQG